MKVATIKGQVIKSKKNFEHVMSISKYCKQKLFQSNQLFKFHSLIVHLSLALPGTFSTMRWGSSESNKKLYYFETLNIKTCVLFDFIIFLFISAGFSQSYSLYNP